MGVMGMRIRLTLALSLGLLCFAASAPDVMACTIDGRPSLLVEGQRVLLNTEPPTSRNWAYWALFVTARPLTKNTTVSLGEDRRFVTLPAEAFHQPWRWRFGDGSSPAFGSTAGHRYTHAGYYRLQVDAYVPSLHRWLTFDALELQVR
jgi:hypothetical protein